MRNAIRLIPPCFVVLALLAAGPLAAAPGAKVGVADRPLAGHGLLSAGSWLQGLLAWLGEMLPGPEFDAARDSGSRGRPAGSDPEVTPQDGPGIDPDG